MVVSQINPKSKREGTQLILLRKTEITSDVDK